MVKINIQPHDLVVFASTALVIHEETPDWVAALLNKPRLTAVCRRASLHDELLPIGLRGKDRSQRFACWLPVKAVEQHIQPFELLDTHFQKNICSHHQHYFVVQHYQAIYPFLCENHIGIGGSLGFELATGIGTVKETSDLDLIWYADEPFSQSEAKTMLTNLSFKNEIPDCQVITSKGGFSLKEYATSETFLMKTIQGPILTKEGW